MGEREDSTPEFKGDARSEKKGRKSPRAPHLSRGSRGGSNEKRKRKEGLKLQKKKLGYPHIEEERSSMGKGNGGLGH